MHRLAPPSLLLGAVDLPYPILAGSPPCRRPAEAVRGGPFQGSSCSWRERYKDVLVALAAHQEHPVAVFFAENLGDIPATGGELDVTATTVYRVVNGQLSEHWGETDSLTLMQQLGVLPAPQPKTDRFITFADARTPHRCSRCSSPTSADVAHDRSSWAIT
jgi:hypothetical protein